MTYKKRLDDSPRPFNAEELAIIKAATKSFAAFLMFVFPESFIGRRFRMADGKMHEFSLGAVHYLWANIVQNNPRACILAPRLHLKSTIINYAFTFWQLWRSGEDISGLTISYKDELAAVHTELAKNIILRNKFCRFWVDNNPSAKSVIDFMIDFNMGKSWRGQVVPHGVLSNMRGLHPNFCICDDILSDISKPLEPVEIRMIDQVYHASISSLVDEGSPLIVIGTPQSYEDTLYGLRSNPVYFWGRFPAKSPQGKPLWPEKFDAARLGRVEREVGPTAYQVEYELVPFLAVNSFLPEAVIEASCDPDLQMLELDVPFTAGTGVSTYGGMDVGKKVHPTHICILAQLPSGDLVQIYQKFVEHMKYNAQAKLVEIIINHFNIRRFYYDATRSEMDDRSMPHEAQGVTFSARIKAQMALAMEHRFFAMADEPGIVLLQDKRQTRQIAAVDKTLKSIETADNHADPFWSLALAIKAADDGPTLTELGSAQDTFSHRVTGTPRMITGVGV